MNIKSESQLRELYGFPNEKAINKSLSKLDKHSLNIINHSPFFMISTVNNKGEMDVSPRGGSPGFVIARDENHLIIPDAKGNNRLDSLVNILETGRIGTLLMLPGMDETLRVNGKANISTDAELISLFSSEKSPPKTCIVVEIEEVFLHCAKAFMRSKLWDTESQIDRSLFPTIGQMLKDQLGTPGEPESQEEMVKRYQPDL